MKHSRIGRFVILLALVGCGKDKPVDQTGNKPGSANAGSAGSGSAPAAAPAAGLVFDHVTLLHQESVFGARASETSKVAATIKDVASTIATYDVDHAGVLPATFDVVLVVRPTAMRAWLVGENGDVSVPDLEAAIAKLPKFRVTERNVAVVLAMVRAGAAAPVHEPWLPTAWKATAGSGLEIDDAIDKAWPR